MKFKVYFQSFSGSHHTVVVIVGCKAEKVKKKGNKKVKNREMKSGNSSTEIQNWEQMVTVWWVLMSSDFYYNAFILVVSCYLLLSGLIAFPSSFHLPSRIVVLCVKTKVTIFRAFNFQLGICHKMFHCYLVDGWINFLSSPLSSLLTHRYCGWQLEEAREALN